MRTFIAINLPAALKAAIGARQQDLQARLTAHGLTDALRWADPTKLHLTLRFLGETTEAQRQPIESGLRTLAGTIAPVRLHLHGLGAFPKWQKMAVLWVDVGGDLAEVAMLQTGIEQVAQRAGFAAETRLYRPHVTLARLDQNTPAPILRQLDNLLRPTAESSPRLGEWTVTELVWMQSQLHPSGARYSELARFALCQEAE